VFVAVTPEYAVVAVIDGIVAVTNGISSLLFCATIASISVAGSGRTSSSKPYFGCWIWEDFIK
jgi:hypothetical protein